MMMTYPPEPPLLWVLDSNPLVELFISPAATLGCAHAVDVTTLPPADTPLIMEVSYRRIAVTLITTVFFFGKDTIEGACLIEISPSAVGNSWPIETCHLQHLAEGS